MYIYLFAGDCLRLDFNWCTCVVPSYGIPKNVDELRNTKFQFCGRCVSGIDMIEWMVYFSQWLTNGYRIFIEWVIAILRMHRIANDRRRSWQFELKNCRRRRPMEIVQSATAAVARCQWTPMLNGRPLRNQSKIDVHSVSVCECTLCVCAVYLHKVSVRRELSTAVHVLQGKCTFEIRCKSFINIFIRNCARGGRDGRAVTFSHLPVAHSFLFLFNIFLLILQSFRCQWTSEMWTHTPQPTKGIPMKQAQTACFVLRQIVSSSRRRTDLYGAINEKSIEIVSH